MIAGRIKLKNYADWKIYYYIQTDSDDTEEIIQRLARVGCSRKFLRRAENLLDADRFNIGLTYSNPERGKSVLVISKTTDIWEFFNSLAHETDHLEKHISQELGFSPYSEDASYLVGEIIRAMFKSVARQMDKRKRCQSLGNGHYICY